MNARPVRLPPGADLKRSLETLDGGGAFVVAAIGSLDPVVLRYAGRSDVATLDGAYEMLTLAGSLSRDGAHLHMSVADASGRVVGGHVGYGCIVRTTAELLVTDLPGWELTREHDDATGFRELVVRAAGAAS